MGIICDGGADGGDAMGLGVTRAGEVTGRVVCGWCWWWVVVAAAQHAAEIRQAGVQCFSQVVTGATLRLLLLLLLLLLLKWRSVASWLGR